MYTPGPMYTLPLPVNGTYLVKLYFADIFPGTDFVGARVFDVILEDEVRISHLDIVARVGWETALMIPLFVNVTDGALDIEMYSWVNSGKISGIEVFGLSPTAIPQSAVLPTTTTTTTTHTDIFGNGAVSPVMGASSGSSAQDDSSLPWLIPTIVVGVVASAILAFLVVRKRQHDDAVAAAGAAAAPMRTRRGSSVPKLVSRLAASNIAARTQHDFGDANGGLTWDTSDIHEGDAGPHTHALNPLFEDATSVGPR